MKSLGLALVFGVFASIANGDCAPERVDLRGDWGQARFTVELADTDESRSELTRMLDSVAGSGLANKKIAAITGAMAASSNKETNNLALSSYH